MKRNGRIAVRGAGNGGGGGAGWGGGGGGGAGCSVASSPVEQVVRDLMYKMPFELDAYSIITPHLFDDIGRSVEFCCQVLSSINNQIRDKKWKNKIIGSLALALGGRVLARVVDRVLTEDAFGAGRVHAVARMGFYLVQSGILYDSFFSVPNPADFATLVKSYEKKEVKGLLRFALVNFSNPKEMLSKLREYSFFSSVTLDDVKMAVSAKKVKRFAEIVSKEAGIEVPKEIRRVDLALFLEPAIESYMQQVFFVVYFRVFFHGYF